MYTMINESPTHEFTTAESLTGGAFTAVALGASGITTAGASSIPIGLLTADLELPIDAGEDVTVQIQGGGLWLAGESIAAGDLLAAGASGVAVKATSGQFIFAQALTAANTGETSQVQIVRGGFKG